jgi:hypothetical protein
MTCRSTANKELSQILEEEWGESVNEVSDKCILVHENAE